MTESGEQLKNDKLISEISRIEAEVFNDAWSEKSLRETFSYEYNHFLVIDGYGKLYKSEENVEKPVLGYIIYSLVCDEAELLRIAVTKELRGRGFGKKLMSAFVEELRGKAESIFLEVRAGNAPAIGLYEGTGFEKVGTRRNYYASPVEDAILMKKNLTKRETV